MSESNGAPPAAALAGSGLEPEPVSGFLRSLASRLDATLTGYTLSTEQGGWLIEEFGRIVQRVVHVGYRDVVALMPVPMHPRHECECDHTKKHHQPGCPLATEIRELAQKDREASQAFYMAQADRVIHGSSGHLVAGPVLPSANNRPVEPVRAVPRMPETVPTRPESERCAVCKAWPEEHNDWQRGYCAGQEKMVRDLSQVTLASLGDVLRKAGFGKLAV